MNETEELDAFIHAGTALLGIPVRPEWHDAIRQHLAVSFALARLVLDFPLPDAAEQAPVFSA
jgi:hypothetical protein